MTASNHPKYAYFTLVDALRHGINAAIAMKLARKNANRMFKYPEKHKDD